ncbi:hypothetical protein F4560_007090 [Saccharothrix ecbatanensis]|uniref:Uncharacterized protein n=1 Tax=Saccharothrix ecbatanensis TaxID=1105145 RepID=A0A7W9HRT5_9PSEU|nr:hypothetical protein [Saccharothrix ecbatanensis]MBB5807322.1 hypothetical protein [Saccharothrix ecbatanensis]
MSDESSRPSGDAPQAHSRSGGSVKKILVGVLAVVVIAAVAYGVRYLTNDAATAEAGDCVGVAAEADGRADVTTLDCDADKASFKVGKVLEATDDSCPEEGIYTEIVPNGAVGDGYKLCLIPNMAEGSCYGPAEASGFDKIECTGPETFKVTKVIQGSTDTTACPSGSGMAYPEPAVTYCLAAADS